MFRTRGLLPTVAIAAVLGALLPVGSTVAAPSIPPPTAAVERIAGADRYETAVNISKKLPSGARYVLLASGENFPDALAAAAGVRAGATQLAPILLTRRDSLPVVVKDEIDRRLDPDDTVYVLGGPAAVSPSVDLAVEAAGYRVVRLDSTQSPGQAPVDRYDTAAAIATQFAPSGTLSRLVIATGERFPDALAAATWAAANRLPILLTRATAVPKATQDFLDARTGPGTTVYLMGGTQAAAEPTAPSGINVVRVAGPDRFGTAREAAKILWERTAPSQRRDEVVLLARGDDPSGFADALAGGPLGAAAEAPLLLTQPNFLPSTTSQYAGATLGYDQPLHPGRSWVLGGPAAVSESVFTQWQAVLRGTQPVPGRSSTLRDTLVTPTITSSSTSNVAGCANGAANTARTTVIGGTLAGDLPGTMTATIVSCPNNAPVPPSTQEVDPVLPGSPVTLSVRGGSTFTGFVTGGLFGVDANGGRDPVRGEDRPVSVDFVLPSGGVVGHLSARTALGGSVGDAGVSDGYVSLTAGADSVPFDGNFTAFPSTGCGNVSFTGAISSTPVTVSNLVTCRLAPTSNIWRIGTGTVTGGTFAGEIVSGVRRDATIGLQLRTAGGLIDVLATIDAAGHATGGQSPALVSRLPESSSITATVTPAGEPETVEGCSALTTGRDITAAVGGAFPGTLRITDMRECVVTATGGTGVGYVEPNPALSGRNPADGGADSRDVLYTLADGTTKYRGRLLWGTFSLNGTTRNLGLTLLLEENALQSVTGGDEPPVPVPFPVPVTPPGGDAAIVDAPGTSFTIARLTINGVTPTGGTLSGSLSFAR